MTKNTNFKNIYEKPSIKLSSIFKKSKKTKIKSTITNIYKLLKNGLK